jgi:transketolase
MDRFINRGNKATKAGFGEGLLEAGMAYSNVVAIGADITASVGVDLFALKFPERFISLGIAEQNCVGVAAGLALSGKIPVFATYGVFSALRTTDQIRISLCYNNLHVVIGGAHAGVSVGSDGATHQALEDLAVMRVMPNMTVISPCDSSQTRLAVISSIKQCNGPVYIRFGREAMPEFTSPEQDFIIGEAQLMHEGNDLAIIATGHMTWEALQAAYELEKEGIHACVLNIHTIKPIDHTAIVLAAKECGAIVTAEEHQIAGGLGSAVSEVISRNHPVPIEFVGMNNSFGESGTPLELMQKFGLTAKRIIEKCRKVLGRKAKSEFRISINDC